MCFVIIACYSYIASYLLYAHMYIYACNNLAIIAYPNHRVFALEWWLVVFCILSNIDHYGKEYDVGSKKLDGTEWIAGCLVFVGCASGDLCYSYDKLFTISDSATAVWKEKSKLYLYL